MTIVADGSWATMDEDPSVGSVWLYNDSIFIPADATALSFDYDFFLGDNNVDELNAYLYEALAKLFVIPECLYRGYGFSGSLNQIPAQNRCGNDKIRDRLSLSEPY